MPSKYTEETTSDPNTATLRQQLFTLQDLQVIPLEWIARVHEAVLDLNDARIYELIAQIPTQKQPLANALKYLVDNFELEALATLTSPY